ncbi:MAG TPA: hypothetical protein VNK06_04040, partial [Thermodesulfobacteriota bacterium]|nr:hypothetical protein [Thermodesulfobacteriota bacterium]
YGAVEEPVQNIEERIEVLLKDEPAEPVSTGVFEGIGLADAAKGPESESAEAVREASEAVDELIEKIGPEEMLVEPEGIRMEEVPDEDRSEDYVDLSAELGMEETVKDMAGSWSGGDSKEAYDEFKSGISQQLSREDTETHYNLGIAYMEMELYGEASKEFKIALKDPHLEFDCLTRLGLCSMSEGAPSEAVQYYTRGLKLEGRSDSERMGMMYELALAYEAAGDRENAGRIFNSIYDANPEYRDVAKKVPLAVPGQGKKSRIPLDDGMIEVELL